MKRMGQHRVRVVSTAKGLVQLGLCDRHITSIVENNVDMRNFVIYARLGCIFLCPAIYKIGQCAWGCELKAHRTKNEYTLNIQKHSSLSATVKEPDLPEDMSIFTLWESKQFLGRKKTPVPESAQRAFKRQRPKSAGAGGRRGPHGAEPLDSRKGVYSAYASPAMRERAAIKGLIPMNQGNDGSGGEGGGSGDKRMRRHCKARQPRPD